MTQSKIKDPFLWNFPGMKGDKNFLKLHFWEKKLCNSNSIYKDNKKVQTSKFDGSNVADFMVLTHVVLDGIYRK